MDLGGNAPNVARRGSTPREGARYSYAPLVLWESGALTKRIR